MPTEPGYSKVEVIVKSPTGSKMFWTIVGKVKYGKNIPWANKYISDFHGNRTAVLKEAKRVAKGLMNEFYGASAEIIFP